MKPREIPPGVVDIKGYKDVAEVLDAERGLTRWEIDFAESISRQLRDGRTLTVHQRRRLDEVLAKLDGFDGAEDDE